MPGKLNQLKFDYVPGEDRLLFRMITTDGCAFRVWFTRRFTKRLWPAMVQLMEDAAAATGQQDPAAKQAVMSFQHEKALSDAKFSKEFDDESMTFPLGREPVLATNFRITRRQDKTPPMLHLQTKGGKELGLALEDQLLHATTKLLAGMIGKCGWDLDVKAIPPAAEPSAAPHRVH